MKIIIALIFLILSLFSCSVYGAVQEASTSYNIQETTSSTIEPAQGGEVELVTETGATASVSLPSEATVASVEISVSSINEIDIVSCSPIPTNLDVVSDLVYDFIAELDGQQITTFEKSIAGCNTFVFPV